MLCGLLHHFGILNICFLLWIVLLTFDLAECSVQETNWQNIRTWVARCQSSVRIFGICSRYRTQLKKGSVCASGTHCPFSSRMTQQLAKM